MDKQAEGKRVRTLLRVSSRQQLHDNDIPIQRAEAKRYIQLHKDWVFDREYIEKAVSAYKNGVEDRAVLQEILADARERKFDILLTYMSDRIGRQEEYSFYVAALNQLGIEVWTIKDGQLKTQEHIDKLLNYIRFWQNEGESKKTGMRVRDTQIELVKAGKFVGGRAPYGYRLVPSGTVSNHGRLLKKLEIVEENAAVVRTIYGLAVHRGMGYEKIAKELNGRGIPAITADRWKAGTIRSILTNPVYMGYLATGRRANHGSMVRLDRKDWIYSNEQIGELVIVSQQIWEKAQEIREARKARLHGLEEQTWKEYKVHTDVPFNTSGRLLLTGLVYCGFCGKKLKNGSYCSHWTTREGERKAAFVGRYICPEKCPQRYCYSQKYLEGVVLKVVEEFMEQFKSIDLTEEVQKIKSRQKEAIQKELKVIRKEQAALRLDIQTLEGKLPEAIRGDYCFSPERLSDIIEEKEQAYAELEQKADLVTSRLLKFGEQNSDIERLTAGAPDWKGEFHNTDSATRKMLLSALIEWIEVKDNDVTVKCKLRPGGLLLKTTDKEVPEQGL